MNGRGYQKAAGGIMNCETLIVLSAGESFGKRIWAVLCPRHGEGKGGGVR